MSALIVVETQILADNLRSDSDLENVLESNTTLPALHEAKLPTSIPKLSEYRPHMLSRRLVPGIDPDLFLTTFQRWYKFTLEVGVSTFPICGPVVAEFLRQETTLASGERPKLVWILEQYRKGTIQGFVDRSSRDPQLRKTLEQKWGQQEWALWERYVDLSRFTLGDWKTIEELAPPAPVVSRPSVLPLVYIWDVRASKVDASGRLGRTTPL